MIRNLSMPEAEFSTLFGYMTLFIDLFIIKDEKAPEVFLYWPQEHFWCLSKLLAPNQRQEDLRLVRYFCSLCDRVGDGGRAAA